MMQAYPPDKRVTAYVPTKEFRGGVTVGDEVQVSDGNGNVATATVKRLVALVEVDLETAKSNPHPGQGVLG